MCALRSHLNTIINKKPGDFSGYVQNIEPRVCESLLLNYRVISIDIVSIILLSTVKMV